MLPKDEKKLKVKPDDENGADPNGIVATLLTILLVVLFLFLLKGCHSCTSDYNDTWDRIERSIKTDPYYDQW